MGHLGAEKCMCPENNPKPLGACCGFCPRHHQPEISACTCSPGAAPGSRRYSGAILWTFALTASLMSSSSLWLSSPPGLPWPWTICWLDLVLLSWNTNKCLSKWAISLSKVFRALRPTYPLPLCSLSSPPIMSWQPSSFLYICAHIYLWR